MKATYTDYKKQFGLLLKGKRLSEARNGRKISQEEFADRLGINRTYYGKVERGENSISLDKLQNISKTLKVPLSGLFKQVEDL